MDTAIKIFIAWLLGLLIGMVGGYAASQPTEREPSMWMTGEWYR